MCGVDDVARLEHKFAAGGATGPSRTSQLPVRPSYRIQHPLQHHRRQGDRGSSGRVATSFLVDFQIKLVFPKLRAVLFFYLIFFDKEYVFLMLDFTGDGTVIINIL